MKRAPDNIDKYLQIINNDTYLAIYIGASYCVQNLIYLNIDYRALYSFWYLGDARSLYMDSHGISHLSRKIPGFASEYLR